MSVPPSNEEAAAAALRHRVLLLRVSRAYKPQMSAAEVYEITRGVWRIGEKTRTATEGAFALAVHKGIVRGVFCISGWEKAAKADYSAVKYDEARPRWKFFDSGKVPAAVMQAYLHKSVHAYYKKGERNPLKYVDGAAR